jgi:hypothetical protein
MRNTNFLIGAALGAGVLFMADPQSGRRRRALVRDKLVRATHATREALDATARDASNRIRGTIAASRSAWQPAEVEDEVLVERVRAKLGRVCSHPHALDVRVAHGNITLRGPILAHEAPAVLRATQSVRGVLAVMNQMDLHETADNVPALQGESRLERTGLIGSPRTWSPTTRSLVAAGLAATGIGVAAYARASAQPRTRAHMSM